VTSKYFTVSSDKNVIVIGLIRMFSLLPPANVRFIVTSEAGELEIRIPIGTEFVPTTRDESI